MNIKTFRTLIVRYLDRRASQAWDNVTAGMTRCNPQHLLRETGSAYEAAILFQEIRDEVDWQYTRMRALFCESDFAENCTDDELSELLKEADE
jgi:DNA-binding transcriptional regulator YdaS (Cro superfamily)